MPVATAPAAPAAEQSATPATPATSPEKPSDPAPKAAADKAEPIVSGKADQPPEAPPSDATAKWRDDWREAIAGDDEKELAWLKRFQSFDNWVKTTREQRKKFSDGSYKPSLPENATPEQVAAYRKAWGIPEDAKGYGVELPAVPGVEWSDVDKADLSEFAAIAHSQHVPPAAFKSMVEGYAQMRAKAFEQMKEEALGKTIEQRAALKAEWGADYQVNQRIGNAFLVEKLGPDDAPALASIVLSDGTRLGDHPLFNKAIVAAARSVADDAAIAAAHVSDTGQSLEQQYQAALDVQWTDPRTYHTKEHQAKLLRLATAAQSRATKAA